MAPSAPAVKSKTDFAQLGDNGFDKQEVFTSFTIKRPTFESMFYFCLNFVLLICYSFQHGPGHTTASEPIRL